MGSWGEITNRAARQGGHISRAQLLDLGLSVSAINRRVTSGDLHLVADGIYQLYSPDSHIDLIRGALLALPAAVVSHQSAAHLLDLPRLPALAPTVTVRSHTTHRFPGVLVRRNDDLAQSQTTTVDRVVVTNVARTLFDLAGVVEFKEFEAITETAVLDGRVKMRHLETMIAELGRRGKPGTRAVKDFVDMRAGSDPAATKLERRGRAVLSGAGLPPPVPQFPLPWDKRRRFDDAYPPSRLAIEWDSRSWHEQRKAMTSDRRRDREAASHGWLILRFTWQDMTENPAEAAAAVSSLLHQRQAAS